MIQSIAAPSCASSFASLRRLSRQLLGVTALALMALLPVAAFAASTTVVISQVYGGGGNTGATYKNDFIEIFNRGTTTVNLAGYSVQYASAAGTSWATTPLSGSLQPGQYYLIQEAAGTGGTTNLPAPDVSTGAINLSGTAGKIALVSSTTALTGACPTSASIVDLIGFGLTANCSEPIATFLPAFNAPAPSNTTADIRAAAGCTDTDNNASDFAVTAPNPRNTLSTLNPCSGSATPTLAINSPAGVVEGNSGTTPLNFTVSLSATPTTDVTVAYATANGTATAGSDYTATSGTLTFAANTTTLQQTITVQVMGDTVNESNETFSVVLSSPTNATITTGTGTGTILDDDSPSISINNVSQLEGNSGTTNFVFTVSLSTASVSPVTFDIGTADGTATSASGDYIAQSLTAQTIPAGSTTYTFTVLVNGDTTAEPDETFKVNLSNISGAIGATTTGTGTIVDDDTPAYSIMTIQGHGTASPFGNTVCASGALVSTPDATHTNIVTALDTNGFFMQDSVGDGDVTTSDGIFVFTSTAPTVAVGDSVTVKGRVQEFNGSTELCSSPIVTKVGTGPVPAPVVLDSGAFKPSTDPSTGVCNITPAVLFQDNNFACLDGMLVTMNDGVVTSPTFGSGGSGIKADTVQGFYATVSSAARPFREPGLEFPGDPTHPAVPVFDGDPENIEIYLKGLPLDLTQIPNGGIYNAGQHFSVTGIVQGFQGTYELYPTVFSTTGTAPTYPIAVSDSAPGKLTVGSQNLLHFFNNTADGQDTTAYNDTCTGTGAADTCPTLAQYQARLGKASLQLRTVLKAPVVQVVQEVENRKVLTDIANKIQSDDASLLPYVPYSIQGNDPGGINIGVLVRNDVTVNSVSQLAKATLTSACSGTTTSCLLNDRPPVLLDATYQGYHFRVLAIYDRSLINLGVNDYVGVKRRAEAEQVASIVQTLQTSGATLSGDNVCDAQQSATSTTDDLTCAIPITGDANVPVIIVGDFNAYEFSDGYVDVTGTIMGTVDTDATHSIYPPSANYAAPNPVLFDTGSAAAPANHYSYTFSGYAQEIDHILLTQRGKLDFVQISNEHGNADVSSSSSDVTDGTTARRTSDHDGQVVTLGFVVTPSVSGGNGTITPSTVQTVAGGATPAFTVAPAIGYTAVVSGTCGATLSGATVTSAAVSADCSVIVSFTQQTVTVTPSAGPGGSITPDTAQIINYNDTTSFNVAPNASFSVSGVTGCGATLSGTTVTTAAVTADCTVAVSFSADPVNGACGSDNGQTLFATPSNLCSSGTPGPVSGTGPWNWSCNGANTGTNATCSANAGSAALQLSGSGGGIGSGGAPSTRNGTDFGSTPVGTPVTHSFTIVNSGTPIPTAIGRVPSLIGGGLHAAGNTPSAAGDLIVSSITSSNSAFVVSGGAGTIAHGVGDPFAVTFTAATAGTQNATITITSNNPASPTFTFAVTAIAAAATGSGTESVPAPALDPALLALLAAALAVIGFAAARRGSSRN